MNRSILCICSNPSLNFLLKTNLSEKYDFISRKDVFHGLYELKKREEIELIIVDVDYHTEQNLDFIHHISSSGFYQMPLIVLASDASINEKISYPEGNTLDFVLKPFSPVKLKKLIEDCMAHSVLQD